MPIATGMNKIPIQGIIMALASTKRRMIRPHTPLVTACKFNKNMLPADKPKKNRNANRYDWSTWLVELRAIPAKEITRAPPPTIPAIR
jgi:hypothetical protein